MTDLTDGLRGSDKIIVTRRAGDVDVEIRVRLDDIIDFFTLKTRGVSREDIAGVLSRTLREKASVRHRHTAEEIDGLVSEVIASMPSSVFRFSNGKW